MWPPPLLWPHTRQSEAPIRPLSLAMNDIKVTQRVMRWTAIGSRIKNEVLVVTHCSNQARGARAGAKRGFSLARTVHVEMRS